MKNFNSHKLASKSIEKKKPKLLIKLNVIKNLKEYKDRDKIAPLIEEFNKKQESDYFLTQNNIILGKLSRTPKRPVFYDKNNHLIPYSYVGPSLIFTNYSDKRKLTLRQSSNLQNKMKNNVSFSSSRVERFRQNKDVFNINNHVIDNISLRNYYNEIRQRILEEKNDEKDNYRILTEVPYGVRKSLINQENILRKINKEKKIKNHIQEKLKRKTNKENIEELLINKSHKFDKKNQEISIVDKNLTIDNKYRDNLWNITLRNFPYNGKYEKVGYTNVGNNFEPRYTFFNINKTIEYFNNPRYDKKQGKDTKIKNSLYSTINENNYNLKTKQNLKVLDLIKNMEINGKNLLNVEDKRESEIRGKKLIYKKQDLDYLLFKNNNKNKNNRDQKDHKEHSEKDIKAVLDCIYEEKTFRQNYKRNDFFKNTNLTSKLSNILVI